MTTNGEPIAGERTIGFTLWLAEQEERLAENQSIQPFESWTEPLLIRREWSMPSRWTFSMKPVSAFIERHLSGCEEVVDPFAGRSKYANHSNDLADSRMTATEWLDQMIADRGVGWADAVLLDPPYSPRQIAECYRGIGRKVNGKDTQNSRLYREAIERLDVLLKDGGKAIRCGWNTNGFGKTRGYVMNEVLLVAHGGAHNDTIITAETKVNR